MKKKKVLIAILIVVVVLGCSIFALHYPVFHNNYEYYDDENDITYLKLGDTTYIKLDKLAGYNYVDEFNQTSEQTVESTPYWTQFFDLYIEKEYAYFYDDTEKFIFTSDDDHFLDYCLGNTYCRSDVKIPELKPSNIKKLIIGNGEDTKEYTDKKIIKEVVELCSSHDQKLWDKLCEISGFDSNISFEFDFNDTDEIYYYVEDFY